MKYKVLLLGRNEVLIEDFFIYVHEVFELQTCSLRYDDIFSHIHYFNPDAIIYCMREEDRERVDTLLALRDEFEKRHIALVLTGNQGECDAVKKVSNGMVDLILKKPITVRSIQEKVVAFLDERKPVEEPLPTEAPQPQSVQTPKIQDVSGTVVKKPVEQGTAQKHILVIDDNPMMLRVIKEQLKDKYSVSTAVSGAIALKFLEAKKTDLVLLDYLMPDEDGAQILERIRKNPATANLPVVFLTSVTEREKIQKLVRLQPQGYLLKPIESEVLFESIKSIIG